MVCGREGSLRELAGLLKAKESFLSRIVAGLARKGLVVVERRGTSKIVRLSPASHAQAFKKLSDSRPDAQIDQWLSGHAIGVLITASDGAEQDLVLAETGCSSATLYKILRALGAVGAITRLNGNVKISDQLVKGFADAYADNLQLLIQSEVKGLNNAVRIRKHVVLRTNAKTVPPFFSTTGISVLAEKGLEAILADYRDFYFNLDCEARKLSVEECFVHALVMARVQQSDLLLLGMFFAKNRLDLALLKKLARDYGVAAQLEEIRGKAGFYQRMREFE